MENRTDLFLWANNIDAIKNQLNVEFFFISKGYTPYELKAANSLDAVIKALFLYDIIGTVQLGAGTGLRVREYDTETEKNTVLRQDVSEVGRLETVLHLIENEKDDILLFNDEEHDLKRMKGLVARFSHEGGEPFYVFKHLSATKFMKGSTAWQIVGDTAHPMENVVFGVPADNQALVVDGDVFVFNQSKFEQLFNYDYRVSKLAREKGSEIDKKFKINAAGTVDQGIEFLVANEKSLHRRLADIDPDVMTMEQLVDAADKYQVEMMQDDNGGIILMNKDDVRVFLDLLEDNYVEGSIGKAYIAKTKKELDYEPTTV